MRFTSPFEEVLEEIQDFWNTENDVFGRVCSSIFEIEGYNSYTIISEMADCSPNSSKKHLNRLTELGLVERKMNTATDPLSVEYSLHRVASTH